MTAEDQCHNCGVTFRRGMKKYLMLVPGPATEDGSLVTVGVDICLNCAENIEDDTAGEAEMTAEYESRNEALAEAAREDEAAEEAWRNPADAQPFPEWLK